MTDAEVHAFNEICRYLTTHIMALKPCLDRLESKVDNITFLHKQNRYLRSRVKTLEQLVDDAAKREIPEVPKVKRSSKYRKLSDHKKIRKR